MSVEREQMEERANNFPFNESTVGDPTMHLCDFATSEVLRAMMEHEKNTCLMCNWEADAIKETHLPCKIDGASGVYVCVECVTRCHNIDSFGLTVAELRAAAAAFRNREEQAPHFTNWTENFPARTTEPL